MRGDEDYYDDPQPKNIQRLKEALEKLERKTPTEIAEFLFEKNCKGVRGSGYRCPIYKFLVLDQHCQVDYIGPGFVQYPGGYINFSLNVQLFILNFDSGDYSHLAIS